MLNGATLLVFTRCQHCNADEFSDEPDFNIVCQYDIAD